jgi:hypothetical protein
MRNALKWIGIASLVIVLVGGIYFWPRIDQLIRFNPMVSSASFSEPDSPLEAQRQDFTYLEEVLEYDRSFSDSTRCIPSRA